ncbi:MAG: hypothetical protein AAGF94_03260 [Pseudomonadota bacterium]
MTVFRCFLLSVLMLSIASVFLTGPAEAKRIQQACMQSDRNAASSSRCNCIQRVADQVLTAPDQRLAASFFRDPDRAQEVKMSDNHRHEQFWDRYKIFGQNASKICR